MRGAAQHKTVIVSPRALLQPIARRHAVTVEDMISSSQRKHIVQARGEAVVMLRDHQRYSWSRIGGILQRNRNTCMRLYMSAEKRGARRVHQYDAEEIYAQLRRVSGVNIGYQITDIAGLKPWQSQFLAILAEAYPRVITVDTLCELYDSASAILEQDRKSVDNELVRQFMHKTRKSFREQGLPEPVTRIPPEGIRLTHDCARWLCYNIGVPGVVEMRQG